MVHVRKQVGFGPRPSGSAELQKCREYLGAQLRSCGLEVREQAFEEATPRGIIRFVNLIATLPRKGPSSFSMKEPDVIVVASHYDTKWLPEIRFVGANDGASSTGVLLEIARIVGGTGFQPANSRVELVFFDGEEAAKAYKIEGDPPLDGLHGSRHYVKTAKSSSKDGKLRGIRAMILMDLVGKRDLAIQLPQADPGLMKRLFDASTATGCRDVFHYSTATILDDHSPFVKEGVPAIDLIDLEYGPGNRWWHTEADTLDKISEKSLQIVGQTVLNMLESFRIE